VLVIKAMGEKVRVKKSDIIVGTPLHQDVYDENEVLLLKKDCLIESQKQLDALLNRGLYFLFKTVHRVQRALPETIKGPSPFEVIDDIYVQLSALCTGYGTKINFSSRVTELCKQIQQSCEIDADASLGAIFLGKVWNYSIMHQMHCAIICEILLKYLERSPQERLPLLAAGLTMNIAMIELQDILFNQKERLNEDLRRDVQNHPAQGVELLCTYGVTNETWLTAVLQHHEFIDGSGYPQGLHGDDIGQMARILTLADVYCAKLFPRAYRDPLTPDVAAREIFTGSRGQCFDQDLANIFIKELGIFHPGSFVRLANGDIAVVTRRGEKIHHPVVHSVVKGDGMPLFPPRERDCSEAEFKITSSLAQHKVDVSINKFLLWSY